MRIVFFDTETTGNGPGDRIIQLAAKERGGAEIVSALYKPPFPIPYESMAIHHITNKMVEDKVGFLEAPEYPELKALFEGEDVVPVAHNAAFDLGMLAHEEIVPRQHICTYKLARALDRDELLSEYKLQYLRYRLDLEIPEAARAVAHDAMGDVIVLEYLFERLIAKLLEEEGNEEAALVRAIKISSQPILFSTLRFGKYKGKRIEDIAKNDPGYLSWLLSEKKKESAGQEDWIATLQHHLGIGIAADAE